MCECSICENLKLTVSVTTNYLSSPLEKPMRKMMGKHRRDSNKGEEVIRTGRALNRVDEEEDTYI